MTPRLCDARGFSLVEMAVVILIIGIIAAFSVPAFLKLNKSLQLKGSVQQVAGQLQLARQKAMATGTPQIMHLYAGTYGVDYHIHNTGQPPTGMWKFPRDVSYLWSATTLSSQQVTMRADGRADRSGYVILQSGSLRDTVWVQLSGLVLVQ